MGSYLNAKAEIYTINSLYLELSLSRTNFLVPFEFEIERVNCIVRHYAPVKLSLPHPPGSAGGRGKMCVIKKGSALENKVIT